MASTTISNVRVFDGERTHLDQTVRIEGTDIVSVRPTASDDASRHPSDEVIDGADRTLLPGLIDAHTHSSP